ncbi:flagellar basal-body rod protein FlgG [Rheinheimera faecalis]|uniref:flagellar basal-body rod protein FlgG n=1 Tax=Rheinheimera faecalis TaxID=2901141 RepID=UPI001E65B00A|nr:flagellar basal-body rod protein FlgG [Rheinheimera faecalis]
MFDALYISESGLNSQQKLIDIISNNIANASTSGFKKSSVNFIDIVVQPDSQQAQIASREYADNTSIIGAGVGVGEVSLDHSPGTLKQTNNPLDIAISGIGYFEVQLDSGELAYTRSGRFRVDADGNLITQNGMKLSSNIAIPPDTQQLSVKSDGTVEALVDGETDLIQLGQIELVRFNNPQGLQSIGNNLYLATNEAGEAIYAPPSELGMGALLQGASEMSNVSMNEEMVNLMMAQRGYQLNARILQVSDQMMETINNLRR